MTTKLITDVRKGDRFLDGNQIAYEVTKDAYISPLTGFVLVGVRYRDGGEGLRAFEPDDEIDVVSTCPGCGLDMDKLSHGWGPCS